MKHFVKSLPVLSILLALACDILLPDSAQHPAAEHPYFTWALLIGLAVYVIALLISLGNTKVRDKLSYSALFYAGAVLVLNILNLLTAKFAILPVLYFPSLDRVFGVLVEDSAFLATCLAYSARLLFFGWLGGAVVGVLTGIAIGFNKTFAYWVQPLVRVLGPIPSTAWIPLVLIAFPTAVSASAFLIALAVWFPTTVLTSSGIASIPNSYFEVSSTLGAGSFYRIAKVGIPAAMPHMFLGLFNGTCSSFITLVTAEMLGAKYGIGWYINWQKEMMAYANVYAGLIIIAVTFFILITLLFKFRDRVLACRKELSNGRKYFDFGCIQAFYQSHRRAHYRSRQCFARYSRRFVRFTDRTVRLRQVHAAAFDLRSDSDG